MKLKFILLMILPPMKFAIQQLREKDENSTGFDDEAAEALDYAVKRLEAYLG